MISTRLQITMLLAVVGYFVFLLHLLKKKKLNLKYTLLWIFSGVLMLMLALWPGLLDMVANVVGVYEPTNALYAITCFCILVILMSLTSIVSKQNDLIKRLVQSVALLEKQVREKDGETQIAETDTEDQYR